VGFNSVTVVRTLFEHSSCTTKPFLGFPKCTEVCGYCCALDFMIRCDIKLIAGRWYIRVAIPDKICCRMATCGLRGCKNGPALFPGRMSYKATKPLLFSSTETKTEIPGKRKNAEFVNADDNCNVKINRNDDGIWTWK